MSRFFRRLQDTLDRGEALLIFDGLDEVPPTTQLRFRCALIGLLDLNPKVKYVLVTCRFRSYGEMIALPGFKSIPLAPFDEEKIAQFVNAWYRAFCDSGDLTEDQATARIEDLLQGTRSEALKELAGNPMLLTAMAIIHRREARLPKERVKLYHEAVAVLLIRWQTFRGIQTSDRLKSALTDENRMRAIMERLAYEAHDRRGDQEADLPRGELLLLLENEKYLGEIGLADEFLNYVDHRAGLLIGKGADLGSGQPLSYAFPHRTFQEYLAGCYLLTGREVKRSYWEKVDEGENWFLAGQLGAEELLFNRRDQARLLDLMYSLVPVNEPTTETAWRAAIWSGQMALSLPLSEIEADSIPDGGRAYLVRLKARLLSLMRQNKLAANERAQAGRLLAKLGDTRIEVLDPLQIEWFAVPAGPFTMGGDAPFTGDVEFEFDLPYDYRIARFPITNAQYALFAEANGRQAHDFGEPWNLPNHPVVGITWYDAVAFAQWLTTMLHAQGTLEPEWEIRLPNEPEWEKAARGTDGRRFPWLGDAAPNHANYDKTAIGTTSAVGCFPSGRSPFHVEEMSGNVWEWTRSLWGTDCSNHNSRTPTIQPTVERTSRLVMTCGASCAAARTAMMRTSCGARPATGTTRTTGSATSGFEFAPPPSLWRSEASER